MDIPHWKNANIVPHVVSSAMLGVLFIFNRSTNTRKAQLEHTKLQDIRDTSRSLHLQLIHNAFSRDS